MAYVIWTFRILVALAVVGVLHYNLPQRDIVRVVNTYEERRDFDDWTSMFWSGRATTSTTNPTKDVLFVQTVKANGKAMVYRNQDTGFWPPYFKFDTADLQTEAADAVSTRDDPEWYVVRHYGWRNVWLSIFPNALRLTPADGPEMQLIPWFNIVFLTLLAILLITIWRLWRNFRSRRIAPLLLDIGEATNSVRGRLGRLFRRD